MVSMEVYDCARMSGKKVGQNSERTAHARLYLIGEVLGQPLSFPLKHGTNTAGSLASNDIVIPARGVSRRHAVIRRSSQGLAIENNATKTGTLVNGVRVDEGPLKIGDLICFGPAVLRVESLDGDAHPSKAARPLAPEAINTRLTPHREARTQEAEGAAASQRWLGALDRIADILAADHDSGIPKSLEVLVSALGAAGAAFLVWDKSSDVLVVRHTSGDFRPPAELEALLKDASGAPTARHQGIGVASYLGEGDPGAVLAIARDGSPKFRGVAVLGEFPRRHVCGSFVELFLKLVLRSLPDAAPAGPAQVRRPVRDLVFPEGYVVGRSESMMSVYNQLRHLLEGDLPILITGETGVGKEFIARILHSSSSRSTGPFVAVNCAALPADLLEAELFGIEGGVATGVHKREGKMQLANGGIVFLDEIGDMSPALQAKLLRALQEKEVHPVGARNPVALDVRVLAATNTDLHERIGQGRFRSDLYYRIAGYTLHVPPLRERRGDIAPLIEAVMHRVCAEIGRRVPGVSVKALRALAEAMWPGNVRELEHEVRRLVYLCPPDQPITVAMVSTAVLAQAAAGGAGTLDSAPDLTLSRHVEELERRLIALALTRSGGKRALAARLLGISRYGLTLKMQRLKLED
jgi:DNA-binding NtrC family response regulator